jgi:type VI secretion system secreted protein Hcp
MATSIFARIGTIKGESRDSRHQDEIDVLSWSWGVSNAGSGGAGGGGGAGKPAFQDLAFNHRVDRASPGLLKACATGQHLKDAMISVRRPGKAQQDYLLVKLADVQVTGVVLSVDAEGEGAVESVTLRFGKVDLEYKPQKPDGSLGTGVRFTYDLKTGKAG